MDLQQSAKQLGKRGGDKTKKLYGKDYFKKIGNSGAKKRWYVHKVEYHGQLFDIQSISSPSNGDKKLQTISYYDQKGNIKHIVGDYPIRHLRKKL